MSETSEPANLPVVEREPANGACSKCGADDLRRYPVMAELGWQDVVKCQSCLHTESREPGNRLGPIRLLVDQL